MQRKNKILVFILVTAVFFVGAGVFIYVQRMINVPRDERNGSLRVFSIKNGEGVKKIAADLEKEKLINGKDYFEIYIWQKKLGGKIQAGNYELSPSMSIPEIVGMFIDGKIKKDEVWVTIPEGFLNREIDRRLAESNLIKEGTFINFDKDPGLDLSKYEFLKDVPINAGLQGYYFPDTYKYHKGATISDIAEKMLDNFDKKLAKDMRDEIKNRGKTIFEIVTLASIIEKEAGSIEDMSLISGVFYNRLEMGKPLESDATVNYIIGKGRSQATYDDLKIDSPYNTYKYAGLPPGPIANPGFNAIKAAIYPEKTDYFFFLTKRDTKKAVFSRTYEEHLVNKAKYLK